MKLKYAHDQISLFLKVLLGLSIAAFLSLGTTSFADSTEDKKSIEKSESEKKDSEKKDSEKSESEKSDEDKESNDSHSEDGLSDAEKARLAAEAAAAEKARLEAEAAAAEKARLAAEEAAKKAAADEATRIAAAEEAAKKAAADEAARLAAEKDKEKKELPGNIEQLDSNKSTEQSGAAPQATSKEVSEPRRNTSAIIVKSPITSNDQESSGNKYLKNGNNVKNYMAGPKYTKIPTSGKIQSFTQAKNGSMELVSGELRFTPDPKFKGYTKFTYTSINEAGETEINEVTIFVENKAPLLMSALSDPNKSEQESWITAAKSLSFSSLDPNGDPYKVKIGTPNKANVRVTLTGNKLTLSAPRDFSGHVETAITASDNDNGVTVINAIFVVNPAEPTASSLLTVTKELHLKSGLNQMFEFQTLVSFKKSPGSIAAGLSVNGINQGNQGDHGAIIPLSEPVGPKDLILLKMLGNDSTESKAVKVPLNVALGAPVARVNFDNDSWALTTGAKAILNELAKTAAHLNVTAFDLFGHADANIGKNSNQTLSDKRAAAVKSYLLAQMRKEGLTGVSLTTQGGSDLQPIASNKSAQGLAENRRVDITLPNR